MSPRPFSIGGRSDGLIPASGRNSDERLFLERGRPGDRRRIGHGVETAKAFVAAGAAVALLGIHEDAVRAAADELTRAGHKALAIPCNVAQERQMEAAMAQTVAVFGRLDAAFNNAASRARSRKRPTRAARNLIACSRCLELHEVRAASDAQAGQRRDRDQFCDWWSHGALIAAGLHFEIGQAQLVERRGVHEPRAQMRVQDRWRAPFAGIPPRGGRSRGGRPSRPSDAASWRVAHPRRHDSEQLACCHLQTQALRSGHF
jgi:short subunit dehydrogenase